MCWKMIPGVSSVILSMRIPEEEQWKVDFLHEIMSVRNGKLEFEDNQFDSKEIQTLVNYISAM